VKRLIVNADDFGLTSGVTEGIVEAHRRGIVTSTSLMASGRAFESAMRHVSANPALGVGIHLTLVEEVPVSDPASIPSLAGPNGRLPANYGALVLGLALRRIRLKDVDTELRAQVQKCLRAGLKPTHLDSHQHVHALPSLLRVTLAIARDYGIRGIRVPRDSPWGRASVWSSRFVGKVALSAIADYDARVVRGAGLSACGRAAGIFDSGNLDEIRLTAILENLGEGDTELICHPALEDAALRSEYGHWNFHWRAEFEALTSAAIRRALTKSGVDLITYREI